jgi:hypothetical protein
VVGAPVVVVAVVVADPLAPAAVHAPVALRAAAVVVVAVAAAAAVAARPPNAKLSCPPIISMGGHVGFAF